MTTPDLIILVATVIVAAPFMAWFLRDGADE